MESVSELRVLLAGTILCGAFLLWLAWRPGDQGAGLPFCYLLSLGTIHFFGACVAALPGSPVENVPLVALGFRECFAGVVALALGVVLADRLVPTPATSLLAFGGVRPAERTSSVREHQAAGPPLEAARRCRVLSRRYIGLGILCAVGSHFLKSVPSIAALVHCGSYLVVAGFCLRCFDASARGRHGELAFWLAGTCAFPIFTMLTVGFLGYGVYAAMMVLCFGVVCYRPRWQALVAMCGMAYLGSCLYVTYMRDRDELREAVWQGHNYSERITRLVGMFNRLEWFAPGNERQLKAIDDRLNQNHLVGAACAQLQFGAVPWAHGQTLSRAFVAVVPRLIWPDKPVVGGSGDLVSEYTGMTFAEDTSVGVGQVMEFYINFGRSGVVVGFLCFGLLLRVIDWQAARCLVQGNVAGFLSWYLPGLALLQTGGSLVEVFGTAGASVAMAWVANRVCGAAKPRAVVSTRREGPATSRLAPR